jgi:hypothetical protein
MDDILFRDVRMTTAVPLTLEDTSLNPALAQAIIDAINDVYDAVTGAGSVGLWRISGSVIYPNNPTGKNLAIGGTTLAAPFSVDADTNTVRIGDGVSDANDPKIVFYASNAADSGTLSYTDNDQFNFAGGNVLVNQNILIDNQGSLRLYEPTGAGTSYTGFMAPDDLTGTIVYKLPVGDGSLNQVLSTDSNGNLAWIDSASIAGSGDVGLWSLVNLSGGLIVPDETFYSIAVGGTATSSATFYVNALTGDVRSEGNVTADSLYLRDSAQNNTLRFLVNEDLSADRVLSIDLDDGNRTLNLGANLSFTQPLTIGGAFGTIINSAGQTNTLTINESFNIGDGYSGTLTYSASGKTLTIAESSTIDQNLSTVSGVTFASLNLGNLRLNTTTDTITTANEAPLYLDSDGGLLVAKDNFLAEGPLLSPGP